jgi:hypothetical protein
MVTLMQHPDFIPDLCGDRNEFIGGRQVLAPGGAATAQATTENGLPLSCLYTGSVALPSGRGIRNPLGPLVSASLSTCQSMETSSPPARGLLMLDQCFPVGTSIISRSFVVSPCNIGQAPTHVNKRAQLFFSGHERIQWISIGLEGIAILLGAGIALGKGKVYGWGIVLTFTVYVF